MANSTGKGGSTRIREKLCPLCGRIVDGKLFQYHWDTEQHLIDRIMEHYPAWKDNPQKALEFYQAFILPGLAP